jgi:hypothetical protein
MTDLFPILDAALASTTERSGDWLACRPGCHQCCAGVFAISQLDAEELRKGLARAQPDVAQRILKRVAESERPACFSLSRTRKRPSNTSRTMSCAPSLTRQPARAIYTHFAQSSAERLVLPSATTKTTSPFANCASSMPQPNKLRAAKWIKLGAR